MSVCVKSKVVVSSSIVNDTDVVTDVLDKTVTTVVESVIVSVAASVVLVDTVVVHDVSVVYENEVDCSVMTLVDVVV